MPARARRTRWRRRFARVRRVSAMYSIGSASLARARTAKRMARASERAIRGEKFSRRCCVARTARVATTRTRRRRRRRFEEVSKKRRSLPKSCSEGTAGADVPRRRGSREFRREVRPRRRRGGDAPRTNARGAGRRRRRPRRVRAVASRVRVARPGRPGRPRISGGSASVDGSDGGVYESMGPAAFTLDAFGTLTGR